MKPILVLALIAVLYLLGACAGGPPTFEADISRAADGKKVMHIAGRVDDKRPWLERYGGPAGALLSGIGYIAGQLMGGAVVP